MPNLSPSFDGYSIGLITDVHVGPTVNSHRVQRIVEILNELNTDIVSIVGDLIDGFFENLATRAKPLAQLQAPVFFATGIFLKQSKDKIFYIFFVLLLPVLLKK